MGNKQGKSPSKPIQTYLDTVELDSVMERAAEAVQEGNTAMINKEYRDAYIAYRLASGLFQLCIEYDRFPTKLKKKLRHYNLNLQFKLQDLQAELEIERDKQKRLSETGKKEHVTLSKKSLKLPKHVATELNNPNKDSDKMTEEAQAYERLLNNIEVCRPNLPMSKVIGQEDAIEELQEDLVDTHIRPDLFTESRSRAALLYGPPGNGKTTIATAVATLVAEASEGNMPFFKVSIANFTSKYVGQAEITLTAVFKLAQINGPSILFIDEVEEILASRKGVQKSGAGVVTCFLDLMSTYRDVFFIAATNFPWHMDEAVLRRMFPTYIRMPTRKDRLQMLKSMFANEDHFLLKKDFDALADKTEGFSFSDLDQMKILVHKCVQKITRQAKYFKQTPHVEGYPVSWTPCMEYEDGAVAKTFRSMVDRNNKDGVVHPTITRALVDHVLTQITPTVSKETIEYNDLFFEKGKSAVDEAEEAKEKQKKR